jgi:hypothetical protein
MAGDWSELCDEELQNIKSTGVRIRKGHEKFIKLIVEECEGIT